MHLGKRIREILDEKKTKEHTVTWFAQQLNCNRRNVYDIFARTDMDTFLLRRISIILEHDFFADLSENLKNNPNADR